MDGDTLNLNPTKRWHLTDAERERIRQLALTGLSNIAIAEQMGINRNSVAAAKRKLRLPVWPALPEEKILDLLRSRMNARQIAQTLKVSIRGTVKFAHAHGFGRPRRKVSGAQKKRIETMILRRERSAMQIAKCCKASYKYVLVRAHELLDVQTFLPVWKDPLRSHLPLGNNPPNEAGLNT